MSRVAEWRDARRTRRAESDAATGLALAESGDAAGALERLEEAVEAHPEPEKAWLLAAARAAAAVGTMAQVDAAFARAVVVAPTDLALVRDWTSALERLDDDDPAAHLLSAQTGIHRAVPSLLVTLLSGPDGDSRRELLHPWLERFLAGRPAATCARAWQAYTSLTPIDDALATAFAAVSHTVVRLYLLATPPRTISLDEAIRTGATGSPDALRWWRDELLQVDREAEPPGRVMRSAWAREWVAEVREPRLGYQTRIVRERGLRVLDPETGRRVTAFDSVVVFGRTVHTFGDGQASMLIGGGGGNVATFLLLPGRGLMIDLGAQLERHMTTERVANTLASLLSRAVRERARLSQVREQDADAARDVVVVMNSFENPAHHLWNVFPGVERIVTAGLADQVAEIRTAGSQFYGDVLGVFPELAGAEVVSEPRAAVRDPYPFSGTHVVVAPGGYFIRRTLVDRLVAAMRRLPLTPGGVEPPGPADAGFPLVWIGLRTGSRAWADQENGIIALVDRLVERWPRARVVLDGFSTPIGDNFVSERWGDVATELSAVAQRIADGVQHPDAVTSLVDDSLRENVLWATQADVYLAPNGSSQHKVGWLTDGPGIAYGPPGLADDRADARPGAYESEVSTPPVMVIGDVVSGGERRSAADHRWNLENVTLDVDEVVTTLLRLVDDRARERPDRLERA